MNLINYKSAVKKLKSGLPVIFQTDTLPNWLLNFQNYL